MRIYRAIVVLYIYMEIEASSKKEATIIAKNEYMDFLDDSEIDEIIMEDE